MNHQGFVHLITKLGLYFWKIKWKFIVSSLTEFSEEIALQQFCRLSFFLSFFCFALWPPTKDLDLVDWKLIWDRRIVFEEIWFLSKETRKQCDQIFLPKNLSYLFIVPQVAESGVISKIAQNFTQFWPRYSKNNRQGNQYVAKWLKSRPNRYKSPNSVTLPAHKRKSRAQKGWRNWKLANWQIKLNVDANAFKGIANLASFELDGKWNPHCLFFSTFIFTAIRLATKHRWSDMNQRLLVLKATALSTATH